ncbi:hypothetical protein SOCE26_104320 [Sorangium cellulosum]|uniref:Abortive phage infection protein C-terminal domain-containing protein n=1 Tax=Sorangium cellulosum TaxID=56 RepID=A0A2L0FBU2_SORCE|nr:AIPR family protein [Sorangium cellulosum]AUX48889.1 hypothetical protein SOCE26_104320 [Sorangium cellulosum]
MSKIKVSQVKSKLRSMFEPHLDLSDVSTDDPEREPKILTRCLAALAIHLESGCSPEDAARAVWDGPDDNGIDAAYFDASDSRVLFVQSKWINAGAGEPAAADIGTFLKGVKDSIEHEHTDFHARLQTRLNDIALRLNTPGTFVHTVLISTGASKLARHGQSRIDKFLYDLNGDDPEPIASARVLGLSEVYSGLTADSSQVGVTLDAMLLEWSYIASPYPAYFGMIDGAQLKGWWKQLGKRAVAANIRHSLGATDVNNEIRTTATNTPERFWYFNNGITLVAEEAIKAPGNAASRASGIFSFRGASIVNGAQTVSSLAKVENDASLGNVRVPIRIILLKSAPEGFGHEVTRTNNLQNRVESRDFVAQDPEQKRLREEMAIEGIDYQYVRSEDTVSNATSCELIELTTAIACASGDVSLAVQAKTGIGRFFADLKKTPYKSIFNPSLSGAKAFNSVLVLREIEEWIESKKRSLPKKSGSTWGVLVHGNRVLAAAVFKKLGTFPLTQPIVEFQKSATSLGIAKLCEDACSKIVSCVQKDFSGRFLAVLFKNPTESKMVFDAATR